MKQAKSYPGGSHRSPHDPAGSNVSPLTLAEPSLYATDTLRQLLAIAAGDFTGVAAAMAAVEASASGGGGSSHGPNAPPFPNPPILVRSLSNAGDSRPTTSTATPASPSSTNASPLPASRVARVGSEAGHAATSTGTVVVDGGVLTSAEACALSDGAASAFYLTALVAQTMRLEDYWVHLGHQIEVDQHVEFVQYCAAEGFGALKTAHLLAWWRQYRALVRGDGGVASGRAIACLQLSDGNPQKSSAPPYTSKAAAAAAAAAAAMAAGSGGDSAVPTSAPPSSHGRDGSAGAGGGAAAAVTAAANGKGAKKGRRLSASMMANAAPPSPEGDSRVASAGANGGGPAAPLTYPTHALAVAGELRRFVQWELEHEWAWRQVPREPIAPGGSGAPPTSPRAASLGGPTRRSNAGAPPAPAAAAAAAGGGAGGGAAAGAAGKPSRADKAKQQQLQQQEMEAEEQRLARVAAMPPENIFLTTAELGPFLRFVVEDDLLSHAALHACVAAHATQPTSTLAHAAREPAVFPVHVEAPMSVLPLREAVRMSALVRGSSSGAADGAASGAAAEGGGGGSGGGAAAAAAAAAAGSAAASTTAPAARPVSPAGHGKAGAAAAAANRSRARSKSSTRDAAAVAAAEAAAAAAEAAAAAAPPVLEVPLPTTAMEGLRAEQAKEAAAYRAAYEEELALSAAQQRAARHAEDVHLYFEQENTNTAVRAVYETLEDALAARQQRILQRVVALERALGLTAASADGPRRLGSAVPGGGEDSLTSAGALADSKPGTGRGGSTANKKKGK